MHASSTTTTNEAAVHTVFLVRQAGTKAASMNPHSTAITATNPFAFDVTASTAPAVIQTKSLGLAPENQRYPKYSVHVLNTMLKLSFVAIASRPVSIGLNATSARATICVSRE